MVNFINLRLPRFSLRFFVYFLFSLVILVLVAEGAYYFWLQNKEVTFPKSEEQIQPQATNEITTEWINLIEGEIKEIREGALIISVVNDFGSPIPIPKEVEIEVASEAKIIPVGELEELPPILFTDLKIGDIIQAGSLTRLTERKFKAESIALMVNR